MKILFLTAPCTSLYEKKLFYGIKMGTSMISGGLIEKGHDVHVYELDYLFNKASQRDLIDQSEYEQITDPNSVIQTLNGQIPPPQNLVETMDDVMDSLELDFDYDMVAVSWDYDTTAEFKTALGSFYMINYILSSLNYHVPTYVGGTAALKAIATFGFRDILDKLPENLKRFKYINSPMEAIKNVIEFLDNNVVPEDRIAYLKKDKKEKYIKYPFSPFAEHDTRSYINDVWPQQVIDKYPQLKNNDDLNVSLFRFSDGCLFKCKFCVDGIVDPTYYNNITSVVDQLEHLYDKGITDFRFMNTNLNYNEKDTIKFANEIIKRGMKIRFSDSANLNIVSKEMFDAIGEAGCIHLWYGTETASEEMLKNINKVNKQDRVIQALRWSHDAGIMNNCNFIHSLPGETESMYKETEDFIKYAVEEGIIDAFSINSFHLTGSVYTENAEAEGIRIRNDIKGKKVRKYGIPYDDLRTGVNWEEKVETMNEKSLRLIAATKRSYDFYALSKCDMLLHWCRKAGLTKADYISIIEDVPNLFTNLEEYSSYIRKLSHRSQFLLHDDKYYENLFDSKIDPYMKLVDN